MTARGTCRVLVLIAAVPAVVPTWAQLTITRPVESHKTFSVARPNGAILGEQNGGFEAWIWPVKVISHFAITAEIDDYPVPIELSPLAYVIQVAPAMTTIAYSHAANAYQIDFAAPARSDYILPIRLNRAGVVASAAEISNGHLRIRFPKGSGYQPQTVRFTW